MNKGTEVFIVRLASGDTIMFNGYEKRDGLIALSVPLKIVTRIHANDEKTIYLDTWVEGVDPSKDIEFLFTHDKMLFFSSNVDAKVKKKYQTFKKL